MQLPPRKVSKTFFQMKELTMSVVQGLFITAGVLFMYQFQVHSGATENEVRTAVFITLITSNILLTLVNRSFYYSFLSTFRYHNQLLRAILVITALMLCIMLFVPFIRDFFRLAPASLQMVLCSIAVSMISVLWIEIVKWRRRVSSWQLPVGSKN